MDFQIKIQPITKSQIRKFRKESTSNKNVMDDMKFSSLIFFNCVIDWSGLKDENGLKIECTDANKKIIDERFPTFSAIIAGSCISNNKQQSEKLEDEKKG